jgi:AcrR family transcriptional regulator
MMTTDSPEKTWSTAKEEIMEATYRALLEHGYADLSISRIADELDKSKAAIYYHYDTKDDLLVSFLEFAVDRFEETIHTETGDEPSEDLEHVTEKLLPLQPDAEQRQLQAVLVGLRSQAVTNEVFREQFTQIDERLAATIRGIVERGIDEGTFRDVDPSRVAEHILATVNGAMYGRATTDRKSAAAAARVSLASYIDSELRRRS